MTFPLPDDGLPYGFAEQEFSDTENTLLPTYLQISKALPITWWRIQVSWDQIEHVQGTRVWSVADSVIHTLNLAGVNTVFVIGNPPAWAVSGVCGKAMDPTLLAGFASAVATRYNGATTTFGILPGYLHVETIEVGNEEYSTRNQCTNGTLAAQAFIACYAGIQAAYPGVRVGFAAQLGIRRTDVTQWFTDVHTALAGSGVLPSYWNIHYYGYRPGSEQYANLIALDEEIAIIQAADLAAAINPPLPIWVTETGYPYPTVTRAQQAANATATMEICRLKGVQRCFYYTLNYGDSYSLATYGPYYYPAWAALVAYISAWPTWAIVQHIKVSQPPIVTVSGALYTALAGTLTTSRTVGRRASASVVLKTDTSVHFQQYQQITVFDNTSTLVFSGFIAQPQETKPGQGNVLEHTLTCIDNHYLADKRVVAATYASKSAATIVMDIWTKILAAEGVTIGQVYDGLVPSDTLYPSPTLYPLAGSGTIPNATFVYTSVANALDALASSASLAGIPFYWMIDEQAQLWFVPYTAVVNPVVIDGTLIDDGHASGQKPMVTRANPAYGNTEYVVGGYNQTLPQTEVKTGDGSTTTWPMSYDLSTVPVVSVNLGNGSGGYLGYVTKNVGIKGVDTGKDFYWQQGSPLISQDASGVKLRANVGATVYDDLLQVVYTGQYPNIAIAQNGPQIAYQQSIDNTSGINERVDTDATITSAANGLAEASALLSTYGVQGTLLEFAMRGNTYAPGQLVTANYPPFGFNNAQLLVTQVDAGDTQDGWNVWYSVKAVQGPYNISWVDFFSKLLAQGAPANSIFVGVTSAILLSALFTATLAPTATLTAAAHACPLPSPTLYPSASLYPC